MQKKRQQSGFTLMEILVVVSVVALLSSVLLVFATNARKAARDAVLASNMKSTNTALNAYYLDHNDFPPVVNESIPSSPGTELCATQSSCSVLTSFSALIDEGYLANAPFTLNPERPIFYIHRVTGKLPSAQMFNTCFLGEACGFDSGTMDFTQCLFAGGLPPANTNVKSALFFSLELGPSLNYRIPGPSAAVLGTNVICNY